MGQLLVVKYFKLASNYQRPELIPERWYVPDNLTSGASVLGSDVVAVGIDPL